MNITIQNSELCAGARLLAPNLGIAVEDEGILVIPSRVQKGLRVLFQNGVCTIEYEQKAHFFRGLGLFIENYRAEDFSIEEEPQFQTNGMMLDVSRNAVVTVPKFQELLNKIALMGLNMAMLYMEDMYEVPENPYFGYMRGRYSAAELKKIDDYADCLGIEMIPCIQTLGHLCAVLRWSTYQDVRDTEDILLADEEKTYALLDKMIYAAQKPFRSNRIHLGMDEAHALGLGEYLNRHGFQNRFQIMSRHLQQVTKICHNYNLKPMIWSDMFFRLASKTGDYYDFSIQVTDEMSRLVPKDVQLVFWDYYHDKQEEYRFLLEQSRKLSPNTLFAGGIWNFSGNLPKFLKTMITTNAALPVCKQQGVQEVFGTIWHDNGGECNMFYSLFGLQLFAEHGFCKTFDFEKFKKRLAFCTGISYEAYMDIDYLAGSKTDFYNPQNHTNPSKYLLYQDVLLGLFDAHTKGCGFSAQYTEAEQRLKQDMETIPDGAFFFEYPYFLSRVLKQKAELGVQIKEAYDKRDTPAISHFANTVIPSLIHAVEELRCAHRKQWLTAYKPFGWEVLDVRYGGVIARLQTAIYRLNQHINEGVPLLELEEERLLFSPPTDEERSNSILENFYHKIISTSFL